MALSHDIVSQFAKILNKPEEKKEETIKGTFQLINGKEYVKLDGSNIYTPVTSTVEAENGDRVNVLLKDHAALLTSNITSPSARNKDVTALRDEIDEQGNVIKQMDNSITQQGNSIIQINNTINQQNDVLNSYGNVIDQQNNIIQQHGNIIEQHGDDITSMNNTIASQGNHITQLNNTVDAQNNTLTLHDNRIIANSNNIIAQGNTIRAHGTTLETFNSNIQILNSAFVIHDGVMEGLAQIIVNDLTTNHLNTMYANIDFSNIQMAAVTKLFTDSGIIKDLIVQQGKITGELVGVTIKGDLIEANTLRADKLVILGEDGLYYKLNIDGLDNISTDQSSKFTLTTSRPTNWNTNYEDYYIINNGKYIHVTGQTAPTWAANTYYKLSSTHESGLDGTNILAHSITADRIQVTDLVAFGATIGGYHIGQHSLYSGAKASVDNTTAGVFLGDDGQMAIGDNDDFIKFYKDQNNDYKLDISANSIKFGSSNKTIQEEMDEIREEATTSYEAAQAVQENLDNLKIGSRNYFIRKRINNLAIGSNNIVQNNNYRGYSFKVEPGEEWTIYRTSASNNRWQVCFFNEEPKAGSVVRSYAFNNNTQAANIVNYFTVPNDVSWGFIYLSNQNDVVPDIMLEKGNKATDWTPAPEDIDEAIINIDNKHDYIVGTQTAATNAWTGIASFASLHDGQEIIYWLPWAGNSSGATLNLTLSGGNTTGAKNVYYGGTTRITTHYPAGSIIRMVYRENVSISGSTTKYTGWWCDANYDTNNTDRLRFQNNIKTNKQYVWSGRLIVSDDNGYFPLKNGSSFNKDRSILWAGTNLGPLSTGNNNYIAYPGWDMRYNAYQYYANSKWNNGTLYNLIDVDIGSNKMYSGNKITGTSTTETIFSSSGITAAVVNDRYVNTDDGNYYKCTVAGAAAVAKWVYEGNSRIPEGQRIYWGTHLTHTDGSAKETATAISSVAIGDKYVNYNTGRLYECTKAGASETAQWTDKGIILQNNKTVYLVGVIHGQTITVDSIPFVTEEPTEEDGKIYIAIGMAYQVYACGLFPEHPIFMYRGSEFKSIEQITYDTANLANQAADDASKAKSDIQRFLEGDEDTTLSTLRSSVTSEINTAKGEITDNFETLVGNTSYGQQAAAAATDLQSINSFIKRAVNSSGQPYIELGVQPSASVPQTYRLRIENDEIYMVYGSGDSEDLLPLTRWYSKDGKSSFEVNTLLTQQEMAIEPFRFIKNDDGSLSFRKVE